MTSRKFYLNSFKYFLLLVGLGAITAIVGNSIYYYVSEVVPNKIVLFFPIFSNAFFIVCISLGMYLLLTKKPIFEVNDKSILLYLGTWGGGNTKEIGLANIENLSESSLNLNHGNKYQRRTTVIPSALCLKINIENMKINGNKDNFSSLSSVIFDGEKNCVWLTKKPRGGFKELINEIQLRKQK